MLDSITTFDASFRPATAPTELPRCQSSGWSSALDFECCAQNIATTPRLAAQTEQQLGWRVINDHCPCSAEELLRANQYLVWNIARRHLSRGRTLAKLIALGNDGLLRAVESFDPSQGTRFSTAASWWIKHAMQRAPAATTHVRASA